MYNAVTPFAITGVPGWPQYDDAERLRMVFDETGAVQPDAADLDRRGWIGRR
ncbi:hypothetical protein OG474_13510 [Kribbella sp. NBC_01505]|uniref:hypothetical protein n=1 Tax=Kribbella sp. NBC_01505 TaxID=2903580 RepID=UPI00386FE9F4